MTSDGVLRLTLDRALHFNTNVTAWHWPDRGGQPVLQDKAILELKYPQELALPALAKEVIAEFNLNPAAASKYRIAIRASPFGPQVLALSPELNSEEEMPVLRIA